MIVFLTIALVAIAGVAYAQTVYPFPDVNASNEPHVDAIAWAADHGIVEGYENGDFGPADNILRQQAASMFMRYDTFLRSSLDGGGTASSCADCHDSSQLIPGYQAAWSESMHATGTAYDYAGGRDGCAGCHSGGAFQERVAAGMGPEEVAGDVNPTPINCRTCHQTHETGTGADWALETTAAVDLIAVDVTYDGGKGNLCASCHQPRRVFPDTEPVDADGDPATEGTVDLITGVSTHWGPHHGPQSATLLGRAAAGVTDGPVSPHYSLVENTCVTCHVVDPQSHTFEASVDACQTCHPGIDEFDDVNGFQTEVINALNDLAARLEAAELIVVSGPVDTGDTPDMTDGHPSNYATSADPADADYEDDGTRVNALGGITENEGIALYNWIYLAHEDGSFGVHNPTYIEKMLTAAEAAMDAVEGGDVAVDPGV